MSDNLYINLLKKTLTDYHRLDMEEFKPLHVKKDSLKQKALGALNSLLRSKNYTICKVIHHNPENRLVGKDWPVHADTMIGIKRLENLEFCINEILKDNIPGDLIETGVWRGGAVIFMKAMLTSHHVHDRVVWVADSFEGLPKPNAEKYAADKGDRHYQSTELAISLETVKNNFKKYDLLDDHVKFLKGWFKDTLPTAPIEKLSLIRLDGDMYESTMDGLVNLYPKLSKGGFVIVDDWGAVKGCQQAVIDYREKNNIKETIIPIDWAGVYWRKETD